MRVLDSILIKTLCNIAASETSSETDPWKILNGKSSINHLWSGAPAFYRFFQRMCILLCLVSVAISIVVTIYTNISGDAKALQKSKSNIVNKLIMLSVITGLLSILTLMKDFIDQLFNV